MFKKNKWREYSCHMCGVKYGNNYFGVKAYENIPLFNYRRYDIYMSVCNNCGERFYFLFKKNKNIGGKR